MKKLKSFDEIENAFSSVSVMPVDKSNNNRVTVSEDVRDYEDAEKKTRERTKKTSSSEPANNHSVKEEVFYLAQKVRRSLDAVENRSKIEIERINKVCEKEEEKDRKYIEALKSELLEKYKEEQNKCQKKLENLKRKALLKIELQTKKEKEKIETMCKNEVLEALNKFVVQNSWFELAMLFYKASPEFFNKEQ